MKYTSSRVYAVDTACNLGGWLNRNGHCPFEGEEMHPVRGSDLLKVK